MKKLLILFAFAALCSCTDQDKARNYGGTISVNIPKNCIVLAATWKETDIWITVKDTVTGEVSLQENSELGVLNGKIIFQSK